MLIPFFKEYKLSKEVMENSNNIFMIFPREFFFFLLISLSLSKYMPIKYKFQFLMTILCIITLIYIYVYISEDMMVHSWCAQLTVHHFCSPPFPSDSLIEVTVTITTTISFDHFLHTLIILKFQIIEKSHI